MEQPSAQMQPNPPYDATVENMKTLCKELRDVAGESQDDLEEMVPDLQGTTFSQNLAGVVKLGLFKEIDEVYEPTTKGKKIGYGLSDEEEEELFREIVHEYDFYNNLLNIVGEDLKEDSGKQYLVRDDVQSEIGINFQFGVGDRTLESAAATFLRVLDAAGVGTYKRGSRGYPTRLVVNDEYSGFLAEIVGGDSDESETDSATQEESTSQNGEMPPVNGKQSYLNEHNDQQKTENGSQSSNISEQQLHEDLMIQSSAEDCMDIEINIEVSSSDWSSSEVVELVEALNQNSE